MGCSKKRVKCKECGLEIASTWLSRHRCNQSLSSSRYYEKLQKEIKELKEALKLLITEIDVIEMVEDMPISEEAYSRAVNLLAGGNS